MTNLYVILGLNQGVSVSDIKKAYRRLARRFHPDINPGDWAAEDRFKGISEAYEVLIDPEKRSFYDEHGYYAEGVLDGQKESGWDISFRGFNSAGNSGPIQVFRPVRRLLYTRPHGPPSRRDERCRVPGVSVVRRIHPGPSDNGQRLQEATMRCMSGSGQGGGFDGVRLRTLWGIRRMDSFQRAPAVFDDVSPM